MSSLPFGQPMKAFGSSASSSTSTFAIPSKPHVFEHYSTVMAQFQTINTFNSFVQCNLIQPNELLLISTIVTESLSKMSELSEFFIKKTNDVNVSTSICDRLQRMAQLHHDTLTLIYKFSEISKEASNVTQEIAIHNFAADSNVVGYMNFDIIHRYRVMNAQLEEHFRRLIVYSSLLKDKV